LRNRVACCGPGSPGAGFRGIGNDAIHVALIHDLCEPPTEHPSGYPLSILVSKRRSDGPPAGAMAAGISEARLLHRVYAAPRNIDPAFA
jgi:hypothetical protein